MNVSASAPTLDEVNIRESNLDALSSNRADKHAQRDKHLVETLRESAVFKEFADSFRTVTGLPLVLRAAECWNLPLQDQPHEGPFCKILAKTRKGCAACLQMQEDLAKASREKAAVCECPFGLVDSAVPVKLEGRTIAFLQTGQVSLKPLKPNNVKKVAEALGQKGIKLDASRLEDALLQTRQIEPKVFDGMVTLLKFMADHLSSIGNQLAIRQAHAEPAFITRARKYIDENITEELPLSRVAGAVNTSSFYFCKMFKKVTGLNFTHYVSRVRVEKAKELLQNPNLRISEIAFEVGFQSLTSFQSSLSKYYRGLAHPISTRLTDRNDLSAPN